MRDSDTRFSQNWRQLCENERVRVYMQWEKRYRKMNEGERERHEKRRDLK